MEAVIGRPTSLSLVIPEWIPITDSENTAAAASRSKVECSYHNAMLGE